MTRDSGARKALRELRKSLLREIRRKDADSVGNGLSLYRSLVNDYLEHRNRYNLVPPGDGKQTGVLGTGGFQEIEWIRQDYHSFLEQAFRSPSVDTLLQVLRFPYRITSGAIGHRDSQLINTFLFQLGSHPYSLALEELDPGRLHSVTIDRLWRNPKELANFTIRSELEDSDDPEYVEYLTSVSEGILSYFSGVLKTSVDRRRREDYDEFLEGLGNTFDDMTWWVPGYRDWQVHSRNGGGFQSRELPKSPDVYRAVEKFIERIRSLKRLARFGIYGWLLGCFHRGEMTSEEVENWSQGIKGFGNLSSLLDLYSRALDHSTISLLGWERWLLEEAPEGEATNIDFGPYIDRAFLVCSSQLMHDGIPDFELPSQVESAKHISNLVAPDGRLQNVAEEILQDFGRYSALIELDSDALSERMNGFFEQVAEMFTTRWTTLVQESELETERVNRFQESVLTGYNDAVELELLFKGQDATQTVGEDETNYDQNRWIGYNFTLEKEFFIPESSTNLSHFGKDLGERLKKSEAQRQLEALKQTVETLEIEGEMESLIEATERSLVEMRDSGYTPTVIMNNVWRIYAEMRRRGELRSVEAPSADVQNYWSGRFRQADTYALRVGSESEIIVVDIGRLGYWQSFTPWEGGIQDGVSVLGNRIKYELSSISEEEARRWIKENPDGVLQEREDGSRENQDEAVNRLRQRVHLRMFTRVELDLTDSGAAIHIPVPRTEA